MKYRAEIDGLRAIAVVPVIFFHAGFEIFSGGFVGVDIFFVISGYLITNIILFEIEQQKFSILYFYERRARRILPELFLVMFFCLVMAWLLLLPRELKEFSQSLIAVALFSSNFFFAWQDGGYFDTAVELKPLLHTWSLAVEEQYYLLFPLFLLCVRRIRKKYVIGILVIIFLLSLMAAQYGSAARPGINFYLLPTRGWELLIGAFAAIYLSNNKIETLDSKFSNIAGLAGIILILISVFTFDRQTPSPSVYTLIPTLGTALVILFTSSQSVIGKILANRLCVGIGLLSYSAYLWHQPLLAFLRQFIGMEFKYVAMFGAVLGSFLLATVSHKYVGLKFRISSTAESVLSTRFVWYFAILGTLFFIILGLLGVFNPTLGLNDIDRQKAELWTNYSDESWKDLGGLKKTKFSESSKGHRLLIIGDSYAQDFHKALYTFREQDYKKLDVVTIDVSRRCKNVLSNTSDLNDHLFLTDRHCWGSGNVRRIDAPQYANLIKEADLIIVRSFWDDLPTIEMPALYDYLNEINPDKVVFLGANVFGNYHIGRKTDFFKENTKLVNPSLVFPYSKYKNYNTVQLIALAQVLMIGRHYFDVQRYFCESDFSCNVYNLEGRLLTVDGAHLSHHGKKELIDRLFSDERFLRLWAGLKVR